MDTKIKGYIFGIISAISYAMNPLCALTLYEAGHNVNTVLVYRFLFGIAILGGLMLVQRKSFAITRREAVVLTILGIIFAASSVTYFESFRYLGGGVATTVVFMYPVLVALIMALFFKERITLPIGFAVLLTLGGILLLYQAEDGTRLSTVGILLALLSALAYALYIVVVNRTSLIMSSVKLTFYALIPCLLTILLWSWCSGAPVAMLHGGREWFFAALLGLLPTVISLVFMTMAIHCIGSTPTAVMGALEPVTAVLIGFFVFGEPLTMRIGLGVAVILAAVFIIIFGSRLARPVRAARKVRSLFRKFI